MEIIQTIWTALTTENEVLTNIILIPLHFIEAYVLMFVYIALLNQKLTVKRKVIFVLYLAFFSILSRYVIPSPFNIYINFISIILGLMFIFKVNILKSIACLFASLIFSAIIDSILTKIYFSLFSIEVSTGVNIPLARLIVSLLNYAILIVLSMLIKYFRLNFSKLQVLDKKKRMLLVFSTIFGIVLIGLQAYMITYYVAYLPFFITLLNLITLILYFGISFYTMFTTSQLETTSTNLEEAQLYNKTLEILQDNTRAFRHDFRNILQGMQGYIDKNDMEGLKKYYDQLLDDIQTSNNLTTLSPKVVNNPAIYNVLASKYHKADELGIKINLEAFLDMNELHVKIYEFTRVLGILMDNAIEACKDCEEKVINVNFRKDNRKHMQLLVIENTYNNKDVDVEKIFEKGYSTKKENTGLGLWEIRQILKKNNNLNLYTTKNDKYFTQQFEIFY